MGQKNERPSAAHRDERSVGGQPIAGGPLRRRDLLRRHLGCDLTAQPYRFLVAAHRRKVEPLVGGDVATGFSIRFPPPKRKRGAGPVLVSPHLLLLDQSLPLHVTLPPAPPRRGARFVVPAGSPRHWRRRRGMAATRSMSHRS